MSEEQFWASNPRIIKVWEKAWRQQKEYENKYNHMMFGSYAMSAMATAIAQVMQPMLCKGKKSHAKYITKPVDIFEEVKPKKRLSKAEQKKNAIEAFMLWSQDLQAKSQERR